MASTQLQTGYFLCQRYIDIEAFNAFNTDTKDSDVEGQILQRQTRCQE